MDMTQSIVPKSDQLERWLPIPGYPGYEVSSLGNVRSLNRLTVTRGKRAPYTVEPLTEPAAPTEADVAASTDTAQLRAWWGEHHDLRPSIQARVDALKADEVPADGGLFDQGGGQS